MEVIHIRNKRNTDNEIYIGRGSKWGNPFVIGASGDRETVIRKYRDYLVNNKELLQCLHELKGKTLVCYCKPRACHGDVLIELCDMKREFDITFNNIKGD